MNPVLIHLPDITTGDTWEGLDIGPLLFDDLTPPVALASCRLYFRFNRSKLLAYGFTSVVTGGFGLIVIDDAVNWEATIAPQVLPLVAGLYTWDYETTDATGIIRTLYQGTLSVLQDVSYD